MHPCGWPLCLVPEAGHDDAKTYAGYDNEKTYYPQFISQTKKTNLKLLMKSSLDLHLYSQSLSNLVTTI